MNKAERLKWEIDNGKTSRRLENLLDLGRVRLIWDSSLGQGVLPDEERRKDRSARRSGKMSARQQRKKR